MIHDKQQDNICIKLLMLNKIIRNRKLLKKTFGTPDLVLGARPLQTVKLKA